MLYKNKNSPVDIKKKTEESDRLFGHFQISLKRD